MKKEIDKMYEQEPKTWYAKILVALIVAALLAWSMSTVQSGTTGGDGLTVAGKIISGIFHPDTALLFNFTTSGVAYLLLETMCIAFLGTIVGAVLSIPLSFLAAANLVPKPIALIFRVFIMGDPHNTGICIWTDVHPCDGTGTICGTSDDVPVLDRYDQQDVY